MDLDVDLRFRKLERNFKVVVLLLILSIILLSLSFSGVIPVKSGVVKAQSVQLYNKEGKLRAVLECTNEDGAELAFFTGENNQVANFSVYKDRTALIALGFSNNSETPICMLRSTQDRLSNLTLLNANGNPHVKLFSGNKGGTIELLSEPNTAALEIKALENIAAIRLTHMKQSDDQKNWLSIGAGPNSYFLNFPNEKMERAVTLGVNSEGLSVLNIIGKDGNTCTRLGTENDGKPFLMIAGPKGKQTWSAPEE